jgi:predicted component of type VI protein secretion system
MRSISWIVFIGLASALLLAACEKSPASAEAAITEQESPPASPAQTSVAAEKPDRVVVYYFHGDFRCRTCTMMEKLADQAIKVSFSEELRTGKLEWKVINTDREENKHFTKDYELYTKALIVASYKDGKQSKWKNCEKIWEYIGEPTEYALYIQKEIGAFLSGE